MHDRTFFRLQDILDAIAQISMLLEGKDYEAVHNDRIVRAAFERFLEIISEASRHIPETLTDSAPEIPWRRVRDIGNHLRHAYNRVDAETLWNLHAQGDLARLKDAIQGFVDQLGP